jgi:hypothetical protein
MKYNSGGVRAVSNAGHDPKSPILEKRELKS